MQQYARILNQRIGQVLIYLFIYLSPFFVLLFSALWWMDAIKSKKTIKTSMNKRTHTQVEPEARPEEPLTEERTNVVCTCGFQT